MVAKPDLDVMVSAWVRGWALSRGFAVEPLDAAFHVDVGLADRTHEFVLLQVGGGSQPAGTQPAGPQEIRAIADAALRRPGRNWVTVVTDEPEAAARQLIDAGLAVDGDTEWFMTIDLEDQIAASLPDGYGIEITPPVGDGASAPSAGVDAVRVATVLAARRGPSARSHDGVADQNGSRVAATGQIAIDGMVAVPDRITTMPAHRRRGLGGAMMHALVSEAMRMGATVGYLVASVDGEQLYRRLGWSPAARTVIGRTMEPATASSS